MKTFCGVFFIVIFLFFGAPPSAAENLTSSELIEKSDIYDGKKVIYRGEVIGEVMRRGDYAWINVNDGSHALGVWAKVSDVENLSFSGGYRIKGDIVEVKGTFHEACAAHGGDLDIHADQIRIITPGEEITLPLDAEKVRMSLILGVVAFFLLVIYIVKKRVIKSR